MDSVIHILPEFVANQIAAGEVVNRPASALKEMLENAVDAGADRIEVYVQDAGKTLVQVTDNGCGMNESDAQTCFQLHATSKLSAADDLLHIHTMGFRGEALASIAAVGQVELQTRRAQDETGCCVTVEGGKIIKSEAVACAPGTSVKLKNIYFNTPARREFLKSDEVEFRYIEEEFNRVALAHPSIKFSFYKNGQKIYQLDAGKTFLRIVQIMGKSFEPKLLKVSERVPGVEVMGYLCSPDYCIKGRSKQYIFVNNRFVRHFGLSGAVEKAYEGLLPEGKNPVFFLFLNVEPESIDVNIHPTKTEIRFKDERLLYALLLSAGKHTLGINQVHSVLDFDSEGQLPYRYQQQGYVPPQPAVNLQPGYNPFNADYRRRYEESMEVLQGKPFVDMASTQLELDCYNEIVSDTRLEPAGSAASAVSVSEPAAAAAVGVQASGEVSVPRIFQIFNAYIVTPLKSGLAVIDQEAASERVCYNEFIQKTAAGASVPSQSTLFPETLEFSAPRAEMLKDVLADLNRLGWIIEWVGGYGFLVSGFPVDLKEQSLQQALENILDHYAAELMRSKADMRENLAVSVAGALAVKRGTPMQTDQMLYLAGRLFAGPHPEVSPSGKRIIWILSENELGSIFKR